jgi:hypothetical protein
MSFVMLTDARAESNRNWGQNEKNIRLSMRFLPWETETKIIPNGQWLPETRKELLVKSC